MITRNTIMFFVLFGAWGNAQQSTSDENIEYESVFGTNGITSLKFLPNNIMLAAEKRGVLIYLPQNQDGTYSEVSPLLDLTSVVDPEGENGLLGLEVDPDFQNQPFVYLFYSTSSDQRLVRYTLNSGGTTLDEGSEWILLSGLPRLFPFHNAGDIRFAPNDPDHLYISLGDDNDPNNAQEMDVYNGKILKVKKTDGMAPTNNPFFDGDENSIASRIWAKGFRNPFRITFTPSLPDVMFVSENGGPAGVTEQDRVLRVTEGGNCAWSQQAYNSGASSDWYNPPDGGCIFLVSSTPSTAGIIIAEQGGFASTSPVLYWGKAYRRGIQRYTFTDEFMTELVMAPNGEEVLAPGETGIHFEWGPEGSLYTTHTNGDEAPGAWQQVKRYNYIGPALGLKQIKKNDDLRKSRVILPWLNPESLNPTLELVDLLGRNAYPHFNKQVKFSVPQ